MKILPILKVNTPGPIPSLLLNLFVACGLLPVPIHPVFQVGVLCHVIQGINLQEITFVGVFPRTFFKLIAQPVQHDKDLRKGAMDSVQGQTKTEVLHARGNGQCPRSA